MKCPQRQHFNFDYHLRKDERFEKLGSNSFQKGPFCVIRPDRFIDDACAKRRFRTRSAQRWWRWLWYGRGCGVAEEFQAEDELFLSGVNVKFGMANIWEYNSTVECRLRERFSAEMSYVPPGKVWMEMMEYCDFAAINMFGILFELWLVTLLLSLEINHSLVNWEAS